MSEASGYIICEQLVKIFQVADVEVFALQGLDLTIKKGELIGIVGASGSGKSTLMNVLGGLIRPSAGQVVVNGQNLLKMPSRHLDQYRREQVGFVWQQGNRNLVPYLTTIQNVILPMTLAGKAGKQVRERAEMLLEMVDLSDFHHHKPSQLSGGQQQRVAIAVALANEPGLLLADEPTGELDSTTSDQVYALFQQLNREQNLTIVIVSHDPEIAKHVNRVVAIRDGKTASETIRRITAPTEKASQEHDETHFEELTVLDSAGRLQIPKEYREQLAIKNRVHVEVTESGLLIRPANDLQGTSSQEELQIERNYDAPETDSKAGFLSRFTRRRSDS